MEKMFKKWLGGHGTDGDFNLEISEYAGSEPR